MRGGEEERGEYTRPGICSGGESGEDSKEKEVVMESSRQDWEWQKRRESEGG
jgi:hypothetical protein